MSVAVKVQGSVAVGPVTVVVVAVSVAELIELFVVAVEE